MASLCHCHVLRTFTSLIPSSSASSTNVFYAKERNFCGNTPRHRFHVVRKSLRVYFALAESDSSNKSLEPSPQILLQELADTFDLPPDFFAKLPSDLRLDLNDAAFDLSNGPVIDQCGQNLGETLLNISRAWELADTPYSFTLVTKLPPMVNSLIATQKSGKAKLDCSLIIVYDNLPSSVLKPPSMLPGLALGRRLVSAGRRFQGMGQYGKGELQKIAKSMIAAGELLSSTADSTAPTDEQPEGSTRMFKFGELQVQVTSQSAYIGAVISIVFGILSWQISQGIQNTPESSLVYANDNAVLLAKSLRGAILGLFYTSTVLSAFASVGLFLLGRELSSKEKQ